MKTSMCVIVPGLHFVNHCVLVPHLYFANHCVLVPDLYLFSHCVLVHGFHFVSHCVLVPGLVVASLHAAFRLLGYYAVQTVLNLTFGTTYESRLQGLISILNRFQTTSRRITSKKTEDYFNLGDSVDLAFFIRICP